MPSECVKINEIEMDKSKELTELKQVLDSHKEYLKQKQETYLELLAFLSKQQDWQRDVIIIKGEDWDEFYSTDDEDYEMNILGYVQACEFYDKFPELVGIKSEDFDNNFVSAKYIDDYTYNTIELTININNIDQVFIIDAV